ncbi:MAG: alpha/beta fold hydrolase [Clostridia bacterium]
MNINKYYKMSDFDGLLLSINILEPNTEPKGIVQISHGMCDHKNRYNILMRFLADNGYVCIAHDHRGHGSSVIKPFNDLGYFYDNTGTAVVQDMITVSNFIKEKYPNLPLFVLSFSMGSLVAREYMKTQDSEISGIIHIGAPSKNSLTSVGIVLSKVLAFFQTDRKRSRIMKILTTGFSSSWITTDKKELELALADKLCDYTFTLNGYLNLLILLRSAYYKNEYLVTNPSLPILFLNGENDSVVGKPSKLRHTLKFFRELGYRNITSIVYKNANHDLIHETEKGKIFKDILDFIDMHNI